MMNNFRNKSCRLCLNATSDGNFQMIGGTIKQVIDIVLPQLNLDEGTRHMLCSTCFCNLKAALDFKSTCLDTEDCIFPYVGNKTVLVDIKDVYMREKGDEESIKMSIDQKICRLCMRLACDEFTAFCNVEEDMISGYISELNFSITEDPVICKSCLDSLSVHSHFIKNCLDVDRMFENIFDDKVVDSTQYSNWCVKNEEILLKCEDDQNEIEKPMKTSNFRIGEREDERNGIASRTHETEQTKGDLKKRVLIDKSSSGIHECNFCDYKTKKKSFIKHHMKTHKSPSGIERYECDLCIYKTNFKCNLKTHMVKHKSPSEIQWYECNSCDYKSKFNSTLKMHKLKHIPSSEIQWYECDSCDLKSRYSSTLKNHKLLHRSPAEVQWYECSSCDFKTKYINSLKLHELSHKNSGIRWYECDSCNFRSKHKRGLKLHTLKHKSQSEVKCYECDSCSFKSKYKRDLPMHMLLHRSSSEIQWFECNSCSFKSKYKKNLDSHKLLHKSPSEIEWLECNLCSYKAKRRIYLQRHMLKHKSGDIRCKGKN